MHRFPSRALCQHSTDRTEAWALTFHSQKRCSCRGKKGSESHLEIIPARGGSRRRGSQVSIRGATKMIRLRRWRKKEKQQSGVAVHCRTFNYGEEGNGNDGRTFRGVECRASSSDDSSPSEDKNEVKQDKITPENMPSSSPQKLYISQEEDQSIAASLSTVNSNITLLMQQGTEWRELFRRLTEVAMPYFTFRKGDSEEVKKHNKEARGARFRLAGVLLLSLAGTGVSVGFNFLSRDFFNALTEKDQQGFVNKLALFPIAYVIGIPVFVFRDFFAARLSLRWRNWMTIAFLDDYLDKKTYYNLQAGGLIGVVDNPDQRVNEDIKAFTADSIGFVLTIFSTVIDLISFSGILYSIYPPLFLALIIYSLGGTAISIILGRPLVGLNFAQEQREADFRYALVRVRENAESIAFYGGEANELEVLKERFNTTLQNLNKILLTSRNLQFFTSFYRLLIQILPAAVVAPLYFKGDIEFGVVNQASQAFNHILSDFSLVVYQIESIAGFSAVIQRLGQFEDIIKTSVREQEEEEGIVIEDVIAASRGRSEPLLEVVNLDLLTPISNRLLLSGLNLKLMAGESILVTGPSGSGKTSLLRALAGLWRVGSGKVIRRKARNESSRYDVFFLPQRPYMVLGSLRSQLLYPTWTEKVEFGYGGGEGQKSDPKQEKPVFESNTEDTSVVPSDECILGTLQRVGLGDILEQNKCSLDDIQDWAPKLSLGEQQRLAFARLLLAKPSLAVLDESTSALDESREAMLYSELKTDGIAFISVGHRSSLTSLHDKNLVLMGDGTCKGGSSHNTKERVKSQ